jgi:hypothetical protein
MYGKNRKEKKEKKQNKTKTIISSRCEAANMMHITRQDLVFTIEIQIFVKHTKRSCVDCATHSAA